MRSGLVLIELLFAVAVAGLVALIAAPRLLGTADSADVRDEAMRVVTAFDAGRGAAIRLGVTTTLTLSDSGYQVSAVIDGDTVTAWRQQQPATSDVVVGGFGQPIVFGPSGLAMGAANRTITLRKGRTVRRVIMSRLGRLTY